MSSTRKHILHVVLPVHLRRKFDYTLNHSMADYDLEPGIRLKVPFGKSRIHTGLLIGISNKSDISSAKLKQVINLIDDDPIFNSRDMKLLEWASDYYQHPLGEVIFNAMPALLRQGRPVTIKSECMYKLSPEGNLANYDLFRHAPVQKRIIEFLKANPEGITRKFVNENKWATAINSLLKKKLLVLQEQRTENCIQEDLTGRISLNADQKKAAEKITVNSHKYNCFLLDGVTGSGKTEVYIEIIKYFIKRGKQSLVLVPEIGLTPQLMNNFKAKLGIDITVLHSALSDGERLQSWLQAKNGLAPVILGTRSAIWTPLKNPGVIIIDEEHDLSYKQPDRFRYSARDVAIMRGKMANIPVLLGSATPSMESLYNAINNKYIHLKLKYRALAARHPLTTVIDLKSQKMTGAFSGVMLEAIREELNQGNQILLFLNQRGYSPVLMCHYCGWTGKCNRCNVNLAFHKRENLLSCHHCGTHKKRPDQCPECNKNELLQVGHGTERLFENLAEIFPKARILRIDRDSTRRKGAMEKMVCQIKAGNVDILIGTQMLAKGHDFPNVNLVGILDADRGLFSMDFRASEHMAQLFVQVSGRAGRTSDTGRVFIQTHYPDHPLLRTLIDSGYQTFSRKLLEERKQTALPPYSYQALLRAEDYKKENCNTFLTEAKSILKKSSDIEVYGPFPAPMEKRAGRQRYQLLLQSHKRILLLNTLTPWVSSLESLSSGKKVRWSVDVDPLDTL